MVFSNVRHAFFPYVHGFIHPSISQKRVSNIDQTIPEIRTSAMGSWGTCLEPQKAGHFEDFGESVYRVMGPLTYLTPKWLYRVIYIYIYIHIVLNEVMILCPSWTSDCTLSWTAMGTSCILGRGQFTYCWKPILKPSLSLHHVIIFS